MRSKTSYFNGTLFKKNLARFWPLWGGVSLIGALFPLYLLTSLIESGFRSHAGKGLEVTIGYYSALSWVVPAVSLVYAVLCALAAWGWLYNARSVGMYHSLPVTRKGLFVTNLLSGLAMMLIPYAVTGSLAVLVSLAAGLFEPVGVLVTILGVLGETFFFFASATLVVFVTGNPFAFAALYFIFHFLAAFAEWLVSRLMTEFYFGVQAAYAGFLEFLSPVIYLTRKLEANVTYQEIPMPDGWIDRGETLSVGLTGGWLIAVYALAGAALLALAWALYSRRRSESAGEVVAVGWMKPVFRYGVAFCAAAAGGSLLYSLFCRDLFQVGTTADAVPMAVCMVLAGIVGYYIASMLLAKSLKVFRGSARGVLATAVAAAAACCLIAIDPAGVEAWVPEAGEVEEVWVSLFGGYGGLASATLDDPAGIQRVLDAQSAVIAERDTLDRLLDARDYHNGDRTAQFNLTFRLKGGRAVSRYYQIPITRAERPEAVEKLAALAEDPVFQEDNIFHDVTPGARSNLKEARLTGGYVDQLYNSKTQGYEGVTLTLEEAKVLEAAIRRDVEAGHFGRTLFFADSQDAYDQVASDFSIQLDYSIVLKDDDRFPDGTTTGETISIRLSTYCEETIRALRDLDIINERRMLTFADQQALDALDKMNHDGGNYSEAVYPGDAYVYPGEEVDAALLH